MTDSINDEASRRRRQVVEAALPEVLDDEQLDTATTLWEEEFDHKPGFPFAAYARRVTEVVPDAPPLPELLGVLAQATRAAAAEIARTGTPRGEPAPPAKINAAAATPRDAATSDGIVSNSIPGERPRPQVNSHRPKIKVDVRQVRDPAPGTGTQIDESDDNTVFNAVLEGLVSRVDPEDRQELREHLETTVSQCALSPDVLIAMRAWSVSVTTEVATVVVPMTRDEMRAVVHHFYVWCCELEGARATDALFHDAMNEVSRLPAARTLDPRDLL